MRIEAYTDGAAINNGSVGAIGYAAVLLAKGTTQQFSGGDYETQPASSSRAELLAVLLAMESIRKAGLKPNPLLIFSDSEYAVGVVNGTKKVNANAELVERAKALFRTFPYASLTWVRGHCGNRYNERAHTLANRAAREANQQRCRETMTCNDPFEEPIPATSIASSEQSKETRPRKPAPVFSSPTQEHLDAIVNPRFGWEYLTARTKAIAVYIDKQQHPTAALAERMAGMTRDWMKLRELVNSPPETWDGEKRRTMRLRMTRWEGQIHGIEWVLSQRR